MQEISQTGDGSIFANGKELETKYCACLRCCTSSGPAARFIDDQSSTEVSGVELFCAHSGVYNRGVIMTRKSYIQ